MFSAKTPSFSIITLNFNQGKYIRENIESVRSQEFSDYEHIIVDPGSTDGSRAFLESLQPDYKELELIFERDSGPADGLNKGLLKSTGDFVLILNADDYLLPAAFKSMIAVIQKYPDFEGYSAHGVIQNEIVGRSTFQYTDEIDAESIANGSCVFIHPSMIVARKFLKEKSIFFNSENKTCWDLVRI
jgi:glycosyltransferase involved in cell wall biosynthesis